MLVDPGLQWNSAIEMQQWIILIQYFYEPKHTFICKSLLDASRHCMYSMCPYKYKEMYVCYNIQSPEIIGSHSAIQIHLFHLKTQDVEAPGQIWLVVFILNGQIISDCNCYGDQYKLMRLRGELLQ